MAKLLDVGGEVFCESVPEGEYIFYYFIMYLQIGVFYKEFLGILKYWCF